MWHGNTGRTRRGDKKGENVVGTVYLCIKFSEHDFLETFKEISV